MRDLIEAHERAMMLDLTGEAQRVPPIGCGLGPPAEAVGGVSEGLASSVWSGSGSGRHRPPHETQDAMRAGTRSVIVTDQSSVDAVMLAAKVCVDSLWDHAVALAAEDGPVPLVATEPWIESDEAYRIRVRASAIMFGASGIAEQAVTASSLLLDYCGACVGVFRARLVSVEERA